jgi:hypothetical protein
MVPLLVAVSIGSAGPAVHGSVVINELHYEPADITEPGEFIELHNPDGVEVDMSGWLLSDGVSFVFPAGITLAAGGYLVAAESPSLVQSKYGVAAVGPYTGKLSNEGDVVELRNRDGGLEDRVEYKIAFPWPLDSAGNGSSMGLINPALDNDLGGSWRASTPTPGARNSVFAVNAPPQIRHVKHSPDQASSGQAATVSAKVTDPDGVGSVILLYQIVKAGSYIPAFLPLAHDQLLVDPLRPRDPNPDFEDPAAWTTAVMADDGSGADEEAGDDVFSVMVPPQSNRTLVRYRILAADAATPPASVRAPFADDPSLNFAYFVYDGVPPYRPTLRTVHPEGLTHVYGEEIMGSLPVYMLMTRAEDMTQCVAYDKTLQIPKDLKDARKAFNWEGAFIYDDVVYDHIRYRLRGYNQRYQLRIKRNMRFRFNAGSYLQARDQKGRKYPTEWRSLNTAKMFGPRNEGNFGVTEALNNFLWNLVGVPAPSTHTIHFRVIDGPEEAPSTSLGQYEGDFWGMYLAMEDYDGRFLEAHDLPKANLYKLKDGELDGKEEQRYQAAGAVVNAEDYENIRDDASGLRPARSEEWLRTYVDYPVWYRYNVVCQAVRHYDYGVYPEKPDPDSTAALKNAAWYFLPAEGNPLGKLWVLPYDAEQSWGPNGAHQGWDLPLYAMIDPRDDHDFTGGPRSKPELMKGHRNVLREFRDLVWNEEVLPAMIDRFAAVVADFSPADRDRWKDHPLAGGELSDFGTLEARVEDMKKFTFVGGDWPIFNEDSVVGPGGRTTFLDGIAALGGDGESIPDTPAVTSVGPPGFPITGLTFETTPFSDPQGAETFAAMAWRVAEVTDPGAPAYDPDADPMYEWTAVWTSGELTEFEGRITVPPGAVRVGHSYRIRARRMDDTGRWGHWSKPVRFIPTLQATNFPGDVIVSEFFANTDGDDDGREWFELFNATDAAIDLTGWEVSDKGGDGHTIGGDGPVIVPAKGYLVLGESKDPAVNGGIPVDHAFGDDITLGNSGDEIVLRQGETVIHAIGYGDYQVDGDPIVTDVGAAPEPGAALGMASDYCDGPAGVWKAQTTRAGSGEDTGTPGADNDGVVVCAGAITPFRRGDANGDGSRDISDAIAALAFLFAGGSMDCDDAADVDDDGQQNITDPIVLLDFLFLGGRAPSEPFGGCGGDPTPDVLDCASQAACEDDRR